MENTKQPIVLIDDDKFVHRIVNSALADSYDIHVATNGDAGIALTQEVQPLAILLDVEMPGKNGYETCKILKTMPDVQHIPIIFISSRDTLPEKMRGFELGADDYIIKPFEKEILKAKLSLAINNYLYKKEAVDNAEKADKAIFEALTNSAELGRALRFVEHTYAINSFDELAAGLFKSMQDFGLKASCCFFPTSEKLAPYYYSHTGLEVPTLEKDLLVIMHEQGRFTDFGCRTFINFRNVCLLIKNMPLDDCERYGRIKDAVPFILGAVDGKIRSLYIHQMLVKQADGLSKSATTISATLSNLTESFTQSQNDVRHTLGDILLSLDSHLAKLGLDNDQEKYIIGLVEGAFNNTLEHIERSVTVGKSLDTIARLLTHLAAQQHLMIENSQQENTHHISAMPNDGDSYSADIELF